METPAFFLISVCLRKTHYFFRSLQRLRSHTDQNLLTSYHCFFTTTCLECCILRRLLKKHKTPIALYLPLFPVCEQKFHCDMRALIFDGGHLFKQTNKKKRNQQVLAEVFQTILPAPCFFFLQLPLTFLEDGQFCLSH